MPAIFQFDTQLLILVVMSLISLGFSLSFYLKSRNLKKLSKNPSVNVFDKTFNILSLNPDHRQIIQSNIGSLFALCVCAYFFIFVGMAHVLGLLLGLCVFILCLGLMMVEAAVDIYKNANTFIKAFSNEAKLGKGDLAALSFLNDVMPKLCGYYLLLAVGFIVSFATAPIIEPIALMVLSQFVAALVGFTAYIGVVGVYVGILALSTFTITILVAGAIIKSKVFGFPISVPLTALDEQFVSAKIGAPEEKPLFELSHQPVLEDYETQERKRRVLSEK